MPNILCLDDYTSGIGHTIQLLRKNGYKVFAAVSEASALELAAAEQIDAVILNCHQGDKSDFVKTFRALQPLAAIVMFSGYCRLPCREMQFSDMCIQKGDNPGMFLSILRSVLCQSRYGFCRSVAA